MDKHRYRIIINGALGVAGRQAFDKFKIEIDGSNTVLICDLDQKTLYNALHRIQSLGHELIGLSRLPERTG